MELIRFENVEYTYNEGYENAVKAISDVSFTVNEGEFVALVGHNGSGKSTIARLMNGLSLPGSGKVAVMGMDTADKKKIFEIRSNIGVVFQNPDNQMIATIIEDDIAFGPENLGLKPDDIRARVDWALKSVGLEDSARGTPFRMSGGQKQRIAIAGVLAVKPKIMVLDEATSMLDPVGRREVMDVVMRLNREEKMTVVMITHFMEEAALADRIIVMDKGKIAAEGGKELFRREEFLRSIGLDLPLPASVALPLEKAGILPEGQQITGEDELVEAVCQSLLKN